MNAAILVQKIKKYDTLWVFSSYEINGPCLESVEYRDEKANVRNGYYLRYDRRGNIDSLCTYKNGEMDSSPESSARRLHVTKDTVELEKVEIQADFPGGNSAWLRYINSHLKYPDKAIDRHMQGMPIVGFAIDEKGLIMEDCMYLKRSVGFWLDQEALRLVRQSPAWKPAYRDGKPIIAYKWQPFVFRID